MTPKERAYFALGLRRARAQARRERDALADKFEDTVEEIEAEMREVRAALTRRHTTFEIDDIFEERDPKSLH